MATLYLDPAVTVGANIGYPCFYTVLPKLWTQAASKAAALIATPDDCYVPQQQLQRRQTSRLDD